MLSTDPDLPEVPDDHRIHVTAACSAAAETGLIVDAAHRGWGGSTTGGDTGGGWGRLVEQHCGGRIARC